MVEKVEVDRETWDKFVEWLKNKNKDNNGMDAKHSKLDIETVEGERDNGNNKRDKQQQDNNRIEFETEKLVVEPNKPKQKEEIVYEDVECANCNFKSKYPLGKYPNNCPNCGVSWRE